MSTTISSGDSESQISPAPSPLRQLPATAILSSSSSSMEVDSVAGLRVQIGIGGLTTPRDSYSAASVATPTVVASSSSSSRPRSSSAATFARKHPLLPSAILPPQSPGVLAALSPRSEAKRMRTGEHTPGGSNNLTQWSVPMSPATAQVQHSFTSVKLAAPTTPIATHTSSKVTAGHVIIPPSPGVAAILSQPTASLMSATTGSLAMTSPSRSSHSNSAASSPSSLSLGGSHSSNASAVSSSSVASISPTAASSPVIPIVQSTPLPVLTPSQRAAAAAVAAAVAAAAAATLTAPMQLPTPSPPLHSPEPDDDDDDGGKKKGENRQGASCHQCKTTKDEQQSEMHQSHKHAVTSLHPSLSRCFEWFLILSLVSLFVLFSLLFCTTKAGASRKRRCRKKYCDSCLSRTYGVHMHQLLSTPHAITSWQCPSCVSKCTCAGCTRKVITNNGRGVAAAAHTATTSSSMAIPAAFMDGTATMTTAKSSKASKHHHHRVSEHKSEFMPTPFLPAAQPSLGVHSLPSAGYIQGRAVSAPGFAHFPFAYGANSYTIGTSSSSASPPPLPLQSATQPLAYGVPLPSASSSTTTSVALSTDARPASLLTSSDISPTSQEVSPANMDAIASLLLGLSEAPQLNTSAAATNSSTQIANADGMTVASNSSTMVGVTSSASAAFSTAAASAVPATAILPPSHIDLPRIQPVDNSRLAAIMAGRPVQPVSSSLAPFLFADGSTAATTSQLARFAAMPATSMMMPPPPSTIGSFTHRSTIASAHLPHSYTKYAQLMEQPAALSGVMALTPAPMRDTRAASESQITGRKRT